MKNFTYLLVLLFTFQISEAKDKDLILTEAREFALKQDYKAAIESYKSYVKLAKNENLKDVYFEIANCYFRDNDLKMAVKTLKTSIKKYGLTEEDLIYNRVIEPKLSDLAIAEMYDDYDRLRKRYVAYH